MEKVRRRLGEGLEKDMNLTVFEEFLEPLPNSCTEDNVVRTQR